MYVRKETDWLSPGDCRSLKQACTHAREIGRPLNTHVSFHPYPGSLAIPAACAADKNRLLTHLRIWMSRHGLSLVALWVWHSDVKGRNPHLHVFMHCPSRLRDQLREALVAIYPAGAIDVSDGNDIRRRHHSGHLGSTLDYLMRFKSQQAWWGDKGTPRATIKDANGRHHGVKSPVTGKRWGCTRNISAKAIDAYLEAKAEARHRLIAANSGRSVA